MAEGLNMTVSLKVEGDEQMDVNFTFKNTNIKTVLAVESQLLASFQSLLANQIEKETVA